MTHSSCSHSLSVKRHAPPPDEDLRAEEPGRPTVGDLVRPGTVIETSYGTGPYLVKSVTPYPYYERFRAWSVVGIRRDHTTGEFIDREANYGWINELVVDWESGEPVIRHLFRANDDTVNIVEARAFTSSRSGQLAMF